MKKKKIILTGVSSERSATYSGEFVSYREVSERFHSYLIGSFTPDLLKVYAELYEIVNLDEYEYLRQLRSGKA